MSSLTDVIAQGRRIAAHRSWPRVVVTAEAWRALAVELGGGRATLLSLWGEAGASSSVHMAVMAQKTIAVVSLECPQQTFPSVGALHRPAIRLERAIHSLYGLEPTGAADTRPWLDLGFWDVQFPLGATRRRVTGEAYAFLPVEGDNLHRIPVGPVHAGIIEPGHFRFTCSGETVARLEQRFGYVHKGIDGLMADATIATAAKLAARTSGDSTVAYAIAFAHAVEAALNIEVPMQARYLRALMAELERLANHFGDIGAICNDASFAIMHAHCGVLREHVLRAADACFGHRLMMDCVIPGGVACNIRSTGLAVLRDALNIVRQRFPSLIELYDNTASLQDRTVGTGIVRTDYATAFGAPGYVGRASGRNFDARKALAYAPYDELEFTVPVLTEGDVNARVWIRIREVEQSIALIEQLLARLRDDAISATFSGGSGEGLGFAESFRGDVLAAVRIDDGRIKRCHLRDPSWFQWPLLETAIEGNIVADFPLCNKSFNCSYSGHDL
jgi:Ni,Fe-hydrogenase III large subunit/Ni,Fe-hydrogenase III component G